MSSIDVCASLGDARNTNLVLQDDVTPFKGKSQQQLCYCEISIYKQL